MQMNLQSRLLTALIVLFLFSVGFANDGMWFPSEIDKLPFNSLKNMGLELTAIQIYNPDGIGLSDAVISVDGGSGSFLSPDGLIVTNHHVAYDAIQQQSTPEHNYLDDGFYAKTKEEELPAVGYDAHIMLGYEDVTKPVLGAINDKMTGLQRFNAIEKIKKRIIAMAEKGQDIKCELAEFYGGAKYYLVKYFRIQDVRIVFAPPRFIGDYGGEIDNWMWPRHAGDFTFLRLYVAPDGKSAGYDKRNVPYRPKNILKISTQGVNEKDFLMVMGYPGGTNRYEYSKSIDKIINFDYPNDIKARLDVIGILEAASAKNPEDAIKLSGNIKGIYNYLKKNQGMLDGFKKLNLLEDKIAEEKKLAQFISSSPALTGRYEHLFASLDSMYNEQKKWQEKEFILNDMAYRVDYLYMALKIYKWAREKEKPDIDRESRYQFRDTLDHKNYLRDAQINLVPSAEKEVLIYYLNATHALPEGAKIKAVEKIFEGQDPDNQSQIIAAFANNLYARTKLGTIEERLRMFGLKRSDLSKENDPFIEFAALLQSDRDEIKSKNDALSGEITRLMPQFIAAYGEWKITDLYSDANSTMRFNYGTVCGYKPRDAVNYSWYTTLSGVIEKNSGIDPFIAPDKLVQVFKNKDFGSHFNDKIGDVPIDFLSDNDITNGNSGSPVMNGRGELVGLAFDGNYESMTSDYRFEPQITRMISVDIRYILFLLDKVYHADGLLKELTIQ
jgi:hypothetical protein